MDKYITMIKIYITMIKWCTIVHDVKEMCKKNLVENVDVQEACIMNLKIKESIKYTILLSSSR